MCSDFYLTQHLPDRSSRNYRIGRTLAADERSEVIFSTFQGKLPWQPVLWAKSTSSRPTQPVVGVTFARAAPPAYETAAVAIRGTGKQIT